MKQQVSVAMIPSAKRSDISQRPPIEDLPDFILTEILCRLPHIKHVIRCKVVSKNWCTLLSSPYFVCRYLRFQRDHQKPIQRAMVLVAYRYAKLRSLVLTLSPHHHLLLKTGISNDVFSFPPCFQDRDYPQDEYGSHMLSMLATYNDLVLCSLKYVSERDYFICNPYTKEWARLPPTPRIVESDPVPVGFICDPYYHITEGTRESTCSNNIKLNAEYRFKVVRILPNPICNALGQQEGINLQIFSSEIGEWKEYPSSKILCQQQDFYSFLYDQGGVAFNGKIYWVKKYGSMFELDPLSISSTADVIDKCRIIDAPAVHGSLISSHHIAVCAGRLRMCPTFFHAATPIIIWELRESKEGGKAEWCLIFKVSVSEMVRKQVPLRMERFIILNFHPIHEDIVYFEFIKSKMEPRYIVMCNVREKTLEMVAHCPFTNIVLKDCTGNMLAPKKLWHDGTWYIWASRSAFLYVIPWWPTPIPRRPEYHNVTLNVTVVGEDTFTAKVGSLSTVRRLKQDLERERGSGRISELHFDGRLLEDDERLVMDYGVKEKSVIYVGDQCWKGWLQDNI